MLELWQLKGGQLYIIIWKCLAHCPNNIRFFATLMFSCLYLKFAHMLLSYSQPFSPVWADNNLLCNLLAQHHSHFCIMHSTGSQSNSRSSLFCALFIHIVASVGMWISSIVHNTFSSMYLQGLESFIKTVRSRSILSLHFFSRIKWLVQFPWFQCYFITDVRISTAANYVKITRLVTSPFKSIPLVFLLAISHIPLLNVDPKPTARDIII